MPPSIHNVLVLGAQGVGKTLLMKRISYCVSESSYEDLPAVPSIIPTVGTNLTSLHVQRMEVTVREVGGCMGPIWKNYYRDAGAVIYVIDASNRHQVSASAMQLLAVLKDLQLKPCKVLVIFNKIDNPNAMPKGEAEYMFYLKDLSRTLGSRVKVIEASGKDGRGLQDIVNWIHTAVSN